MATIRTGRGFTPGAGRQVGSQNRITRDVREMIIAALHGAGGQAYLEKQAKKNPKAFLALVGKVLPKDLNINTKRDAAPVIDSSKLTLEERQQLRAILENALARHEESRLIEHEPAQDVPRGTFGDDNSVA